MVTLVETRRRPARKNRERKGVIVKRTGKRRVGLNRLLAKRGE